MDGWMVAKDDELQLREETLFESIRAQG